MKKFLNIICLTAAFTLLFLHTDFSVSAKALDEDVIESGIYIGDVVIGILKLITCGGCGIWWLIDLFLIMGATREKNLQKILGIYI